MRDHPDAIMLFAAGFGTRMGALTAERPKPMIRVSGRPLIDHALSLVAPMNLARVVANLHYRPEPLIEHLDGRGIAFSHETPDILDTGGGLRHALPLLGSGPVFTMNTDAVWRGPNPLSLLAGAWNPDEMDALLICVPRARAIGHAGEGDFLLDDTGRIARGPGHVYGGVQIIKTDLLHDIPDRVFSLNLLWDRMAGTDRLFGLPYPGKWCDVGHPEGIALAERMLEDSDV
ncbi:nucleotidyltransferase family protein [Aquicoccus porphyridii]|uniref:Nucleotidyltransferase family protein n=1 Tax=Aquicoccus porphyridii TaxID=1852029 RepID=A0A5A9Z875_9RHOB|nr:nucleotidyltransferase family protein [Aquicoccus porphyridii]KAA0913252.1 nucleotidyltransferase family protein [Aquicoccus porphyridii]RAI52269.1 nucleotidyltransferase family protein [Rhodobacteraceae bacterium AsT-22]